MPATLRPDPRLRPPPAVLEITGALERAGFEVWCVGGAVRDALLGHPHLDWDFATSATPDQVRTVFGRKRTIPVGVAFGTVGVLDDAGVLHEVTTFRRDVRTDGRHAEVEFGVSLDDDLARRDFTINAIAFSPTKGEVRDPFDGRGDMERRIVRAVGVAGDRMREDRLRALRGLRFAARLGFTIDAETMTAIRESAPYLTRLSGERVRQELEKTMDQVDAPSAAIAMWRACGAASALIPELNGGEAERALDCAARPGLAQRPGRRLTRLAVLVSDVPAATVHDMAMRLRFSKQDAQWLAELAGAWQSLDTAMSQSLTNGAADASDIRRWIARIGRPRLPSFFRLASARWAARRAGGGGAGKAPTAAAVASLYRKSLRASLTEPVDLHDLVIDGDDLRAAGVAPGPRLGKTLRALLDQVLADPSLNTREQLLSAARQLLDDDE